MDTSTNLKRRDSDDITGKGRKKAKSQTQTEIKTPPQTKIQRPAQIIPPSKPKNTPTQPTETPYPQHCILFHPFQLPSYSPGPIRQLEIQCHDHHHHHHQILNIGAKSASKDVPRAFNAFYFREDTLESSTLEHHVKQSLRPLSGLKTIDQKDVTNPYLFKCATMVTTFVRSAGNRNKELRRFIEEASRMNIMLAEMEHPSLNVIWTKCTGRVPIYVHPCFYRSLKLRSPIDVGRISRDGRVTNELGTGSLRHTLGIFTPEDSGP